MLDVLAYCVLLYATVLQSKREFYQYDEQQYVSIGFGIFMLDDSTGVTDSEKVSAWLINASYQEAFNELESLLAQTGITPEQEAEVLNALAMIKGFEGESEEARRLYDKALELIESTPYSGGDYTTARDMYMQTILETEPLLGSNNYLIANIYRNLGAIYLHLDEDQLGIDYSIKALAGYRNSRTRSSVWNNIAVGYISLKDYQNAKEYALKAYCSALEFTPGQTEVLKYLLRIIYNQESPEKGFEDWLEEGLEQTVLD